MLETEKSIESAVQVRDTVASGGLLDVPLVVLQSNTPNPPASAGATRRSPDGAPGDAASSSVIRPI